MKVRKWLSALICLVLLLSLTACGGSASTENMGYAADSFYEAPEEGLVVSTEGKFEQTDESAQALPQDRKLIRTIRMEAETEDLTVILAELDNKIAQLGGYVEGREVYNGSTYAQRRYRRANLIIRVPADQADSFVDHVSGVSNIVSSNESVDDITLQYVDTESRVKALEVEQERLMGMLEKAETLEELLQIEDRLTDVRYELENYASRLRSYDNLVDYATVHLSISEVQEYTPVAEETTWQRIAGGFMDSLRGIGDGAVEVLIWVLANSPYLLLYGIIGLGIGLLIRKSRKKKAPKAPKNTPPKETE